MRSAIRVLTSARKRLPPGSVSDGSEIALGTTSSSTEPLDRSIRSGGLLHQKSRLSLPIVTSLTHRTRMTRQSVRIRKKHARLRTIKKVGDRYAVIQRTGSDSTPTPDTWTWYAEPCFRNIIISSLAGDIRFRRSDNTSLAREKKRSHSLDVGGMYATST
ncbi:uncharacterized protein PITG_00581 [Phytophthora infestans T30-4]|uniref:Uncharacterized protein n=1 Tax=Phytophthora infestans (strain T30-4) TaxID=403677 RepID=D0MR63_PHYIT|nr:uncharacterized protein PITG_00581 [Phytophthora infestans T30-4]EEY57982.1 hypothetical protein PITG_00581 [Phytophthora infestans T30-4]|eukprot:XP_002909168.1 hypothetical protein PITG_00581 [Phytophthora infestans T30-4]